MKNILYITVLLAPLVLGLIAWTLAGIPVFWGRALSEKRRSLFSILSWCACACALWFPLYSIYQWVETEDIIAILDCTHAYLVCATVLLAVNLLLTILGTLFNRKK